MNFLNFKKNLWTIIAIGISIIALCSSIKSCSVAEKAQQLQLNQYNRSINTVWETKMVEGKDTIMIAPSNKSVTLQHAIAIYPEKISEIEWPIESPNYDLYITTPRFNISVYIDESIEKEKDVYKMVDSRIPVIIESYYTINGENYSDKSLYGLEFTAIVVEESWKKPSIKIKGLVFNHKLDQSIIPKNYLNKLWDIMNKK